MANLWGFFSNSSIFVCNSFCFSTSSSYSWNKEDISKIIPNAKNYFRNLRSWRFKISKNWLSSIILIMKIKKYDRPNNWQFYLCSNVRIEFKSMHLSKKNCEKWDPCTWWEKSSFLGGVTVLVCYFKNNKLLKTNLGRKREAFS